MSILRFSDCFHEEFMTEKTGRNDPCPCGSGKKYKSCCWGNAQPATRKKFKATVIGSANKIAAATQQKPANTGEDLMERLYGNTVKAEKTIAPKDTPEQENSSQSTE
jgi:uncharacterized protein